MFGKIVNVVASVVIICLTAEAVRQTWKELEEEEKKEKKENK